MRSVCGLLPQLQGHGADMQCACRVILHHGLSSSTVVICLGNTASPTYCILALLCMSLHRHRVLLICYCITSSACRGWVTHPGVYEDARAAALHEASMHSALIIHVSMRACVTCMLLGVEAAKLAPMPSNAHAPQQCPCTPAALSCI